MAHNKSDGFRFTIQAVFGFLSVSTSWLLLWCQTLVRPWVQSGPTAAHRDIPHDTVWLIVSVELSETTRSHQRRRIAWGERPSQVLWCRCRSPAGTGWSVDIMWPIDGEAVPDQPVNWLVLEWRHVVGLQSGLTKIKMNPKTPGWLKPVRSAGPVTWPIWYLQFEVLSSLTSGCYVDVPWLQVWSDHSWSDHPCSVHSWSDHYSSNHSCSDCPIWITPG